MQSEVHPTQFTHLPEIQAHRKCRTVLRSNALSLGCSCGPSRQDVNTTGYACKALGKKKPSLARLIVQLESRRRLQPIWIEGILVEPKKIVFHPDSLLF